MSRSKSADYHEMFGSTDAAWGQEIYDAVQNSAAPAEIEAASLTQKNLFAQLLNDPDETAQAIAASIDQNFRSKDLWDYNGESNPQDTIDKLDVVEWIANEAGPSAITALAVWNVERRRALQAAVNRDSPELVKQAMDNVDQLVSQSFFPMRALEKFINATYYYAPFKVMDSFQAGAMQAAGMCSKTTLTLSNIYRSPWRMAGINRGMQRTVFHELLHGAGAVGNAGFYFEPVPFSSVWMEELFAGHSSDVAISDFSEPDILMPSDRTGVVGSYELERELAAHASQHGNIPTDLWAQAFFSEVDDPKYRHELQARLDKSFSELLEKKRALYTFNREYQAATKAGDHYRTDALLTKRIGIMHAKLHPGVELIMENEIHSANKIYIVRDLIAAAATASVVELEAYKNHTVESS